MEELALYTGKQYGDLGHIFDDLDADYWEPEVLTEPEDDAFTEANDPNGLRKFEYFANLKSRLKKINEMQNNRTRLFETIRANLSVESREEAANWEADILRPRDPLLLLRRIRETHAAGEIHITPISRQAAHNKFSQMHMHPNETIAQYFKRFKNQVEAIRAIDHEHVHSEEVQATHFAMTLDARWALIPCRPRKQRQNGRSLRFPGNISRYV
jgi:hypothetical protein